MANPEGKRRNEKKKNAWCLIQVFQRVVSVVVVEVVNVMLRLAETAYLGVDQWSEWIDRKIAATLTVVAYIFLVRRWKNWH